METERLIIRPWREEDAPSLYRYASDERIGPICGWVPHVSVENSLYIIKTVLSEPEVYALVLKETEEAVGSIGITAGKARSVLHRPPDEYEIGYWIGVPFWGKGFVPEAVSLMVRRSFEELGASALWIGYYDGNDQSRRVAEKCGFSYHHKEDDRITPLGELKREHFLCLKRDDWNGGKMLS